MDAQPGLFDRARTAVFGGAKAQSATMPGPRHASTYRGARRNHYVTPAARRTRFYGWNAWEVANAKAHLHSRAVQANSAREAAAKALVANRSGDSSVTVAGAMLKFYEGEKRTRPVNRIIRDLRRKRGG